MKTLELKHLAPYLPYGLRIKREMGMDYKARILIIEGLSENMIEHTDIGYNGFVEYSTNIDSNLYKPILRPLSDLTKEIGVNGEMKEIQEIIFGNKEIWGVWKNLTGEYVENFALSIKQMLMLFEYHFDVFGLIPAELAIDINTL